jgi:FMN phosphatase YigB (HAD superfamily)
MNRLKLVIFDLDDTLCDTSRQLTSRRPEMERIELFSGVPSLLKTIRARGIHTAIVSTGDVKSQEAKLRRLGLPRFVDKVLVCAFPEEKRALFRRCLRLFKAKPKETLIVGDRIDREIQFGNALGCVTVRVLQGRHCGRIPTDDNQVADFTVRELPLLRLWFNDWLVPKRKHMLLAKTKAGK